MQRRGVDFRVTINGIFYAVNSIGVSGNVADIMTSNTEGIAGNPNWDTNPLGDFVSRIPDLPDGQFTLGSATFDDDDNPFAGAINLVLGGYYALAAFPAGFQISLAYQWGNAILTGFDHTGRVPGPQPVNLTFKPDGVDVLTMFGFS